LKKSRFSDLKKAIGKAKNISIFTHTNPDGDAMGSSLGLYHYLKKKGKAVKVIVPNSFPGFLEWMPGSRQVMVFEGGEAAVRRQVERSDLLFVLDFNNYSRLDMLGVYLNESKAPKILIDHHRQPDTCFDLYFHDVHASSTAELVYDLICGIDSPKVFDKKMATSLFTGVMTDTGTFRFPSTTEKTFTIAAQLIRAGADNAQIYDRVYDDYSASRLKLLGYCLDKLVFLPEYRAAYIAIAEEELRRFNFKKGDTEGVVNQALSVRGIVFSAFFSERDGEVRISFRSKGKFDVNKFSRAHFGGGGHVNAAGGKSKEALESVISKFVQLLPQYKEALTK
jgi:bifunctional oligoribonuclease and PAP phosphatase NrnA